jgi:regulatory protein
LEDELKGDEERGDSSTAKSSQNSFREAQKRTMNLLSRRNYSAFELSQKLRSHFDSSIVEQTLKWAHEQKWFPDENELADRTTELLIQKGKGSQYISQHLKEKGLKPKKIPFEVEYKAAKNLAESKLVLLNKKTGSSPEFKVKEKLFRFLLQRGFPFEVVRKVINEKLTS